MSAADPRTDIFNRKDWAAAYQNTDSHLEGFWLEGYGEIPRHLTGTYFRIGPGLFRHGGDSIAHPFDGHGLIASISFVDGKAFFRSQFIQTKEYLDETSQRKILYKGTFGTMLPGGLRSNFLQLVPRNPANTGVLILDGKCLAMFEAGQPYSLDPDSLETRGIDLLGGLVTHGLPFSTGWSWLDRFAGALLSFLGIGENLAGGNRVGGDAVCAHPVHDPTSGNTMLLTYKLQLEFVAWTCTILGWSFSLLVLGLVTRLAVREFDQDFKQQSVVYATIPGYCLLHSMSLTATKYVIFHNPVRLRLTRLLLGTSCAIHCVEPRHSPPEIIVMDRPAATAFLPDSPAPDIEEGRMLLKDAKNWRANCPQKGSFWNTSRKCEAMQGASLSGNLSGEQQEVEITSCKGEEADTSAFVFHQANAFDSRPQEVTVDVIRYAGMPDFKQACSGGKSFVECVDPQLQPISQLWRYKVDIAKKLVVEERLFARAMEFPAINGDYTGRQHRYIFAAAALHETLNMPQQALTKLDTDTFAVKSWDQGVRFYVGEPIFVPFPQGVLEDDGWVMSICYDAGVHSSECIILDARSMHLLSRLPLRHVLPHGLHGAWDPICHAPTAAI